jgi:hypothetical protein
MDPVHSWCNEHGYTEVEALMPDIPVKEHEIAAFLNVISSWQREHLLLDV